MPCRVVKRKLATLDRGMLLKGSYKQKLGNKSTLNETSCVRKANFKIQTWKCKLNTSFKKGPTSCHDKWKQLATLIF